MWNTSQDCVTRWIIVLGIWNVCYCELMKIEEMLDIIPEFKIVVDDEMLIESIQAVKWLIFRLSLRYPISALLAEQDLKVHRMCYKRLRWGGRPFWV